MRLSIPKLRAVLITGAVALVVVLAAYVGLGRYRSLMVYRRLLKRSGVTLTHDTNGFTYSQSLLDRKIFTLHAAKATQLGAGRYALHDAELTLFDRAGNPADHVRSAEIDYDEGTQVARALGVVDMDLLPPQGLANSGHAVTGSGTTQAAKAADALATAELKAAPAQAIHVRASGLIYQRKLGIASTDQKVEFQYGGMHCTAVGAEFNSGESTLRLLGQVQMEGVAHGQALHVTAMRADMDRENNIATLERPMVTSQGKSAAANAAVLNLRKDGSIERLQGSGRVVMVSGQKQITAARLDASLDAQTLPERATLSGGVAMSGTDNLRPMHGSAMTVDMEFNAQGVPKVVTGDGGAKLSMADMRMDAHGLTRSMEGEKIVALFVPGAKRGSARVVEVDASGEAHAAGESIAAAAKNGAGKTGTWLLKTTQVSGDDLRLIFGVNPKGNAQAKTLYATGHTMLRQDGPMEAQETSSGDALEVGFAVGAKFGAGGAAGSDALGVESAVQTGHVVLHNRGAGKVGSAEPGAVSDGTAERATYDGATERLTLSGKAHLEGDHASFIAPIVVVDQTTEDAEASGGVQATIESAAQGNGAGPVTHVLAASARFEHASKLAEFRGTDAQPARMWQDSSQVQAAVLLFDGVKRTFSARAAANGSLIHAVFASEASTAKAGAAARPAGIVRVASPKMDYNDVLRAATFVGGVTIEEAGVEAKGQRAVMFLAPVVKHAGAAGPVVATQANPFGGSLERVVLSGSVQMEQRGRHGSGEQLLYTASTGSYILTGTAAAPSRVVDAQQGSVTGATLMFGDAGSTIVVAGAQAQGGRVRSDLSVRPKAEERQ